MIKFIFALFFSIHVSAFQITQITEIEGQVTNLECDSDFNCYTSTLVGDPDESSDYRFYKISSNKTVVLQSNFTMIYQIIKTSKDNIYLFARNTSDAIWLLQPNSNQLEPIYKYPTTGGSYISFYNRFIIDEEDNILFSMKNGVVILKPNLNTPIAIRNLESCYFDAISATVDQQGNIYLLRTCDSKSIIDSGVVIITSSAKHYQVPYATIVKNLQDGSNNPNSSYTYQIVTDSNNNVIFGISRYSRVTNNWDKVDIKIIRDGSVEPILSEYNIQVLYGSVHVTKDRTYFIATMPLNDINSLMYYLYFIDSNGKINKIDWMSYISSYGYYYFKSDRNGNLFFVKDFTELMWVRNNETVARQLFKTPVYTINWFYADSSDVVWVQIYNYYYGIDLRSGNATKYTGMYVGSGNFFRENLKTKEIYLGSERGVFVLNPEG